MHLHGHVPHCTWPSCEGTLHDFALQFTGTWQLQATAGRDGSDAAGQGGPVGPHLPRGYEFKTFNFSSACHSAGKSRPRFKWGLDRKNFTKSALLAGDFLLEESPKVPMDWAKR